MSRNPFRGSQPRFPESFEYLVLDVQDCEEQNLIRLFPRFGWYIIAIICTDLYTIASEPNNS